MLALVQSVGPRFATNQLSVACFTYSGSMVVIVECNASQLFAVNYWCKTIVYQHIVMMGMIFFCYGVVVVLPCLQIILDML